MILKILIFYLKQDVKIINSLRNFVVFERLINYFRTVYGLWPALVKQMNYDKFFYS